MGSEKHPENQKYTNGTIHDTKQYKTVEKHHEQTNTTPQKQYNSLLKTKEDNRTKSKTRQNKKNEQQKQRKTIDKSKNNAKTYSVRNFSLSLSFFLCV